mgnify:FL=1
MSIIKQGLPKQYMKNLKEILSPEMDFINMEDYEYFSECSKILLENGLLVAPYDNLFNYFFFKFAYNYSDCSNEIKKLIKSLKVDSNELLLYCANLTSLMVKGVRVRNNMASDLDIVLSTVLNSYKLFLYYCFDIVFGNKKFTTNGVNCKYKDFDGMLTLMSKSYKGFSSEFNELFKSITPSSHRLEKMGVKQVLSPKDTDLALFQRIRFKYDSIIINSMIKKLLPDESGYYLARQNLGDFVQCSVFTEITDNEYNIELTEEFYTLLKKRAYLLPHNGISITPGSINFNIDMYERQYAGDNYLILVSNTSETSSFTFINLSKEYTISDSPYFLYDLCNFMYNFYKLEDYAKDLYGEEFSKDPHLLASFKTDSFIANGIVTIKGRSKVYEDFLVEIPYYWRYKGNVKSKPTNKSGFLKADNESSFIYVSAFKRKLPLGQKASDKAKELSEYYCIELEEDETLVSPFIRSH